LSSRAPAFLESGAWQKPPQSELRNAAYTEQLCPGDSFAQLQAGAELSSLELICDGIDRACALRIWSLLPGLRRISDGKDRNKLVAILVLGFGLHLAE
jgi:hypothetical protein